MEWNGTSSADRVIVAVDLPADEAVSVAEKLVGHAKWVKIGMTLYYATGPSIVRTMHKLGYKVFLDLKLFDIPHQVFGAASSIAQSGADLFTVHASGGVDMLESAKKGSVKGASLTDGAQAPCVCAITVLTSMDEEVLESVGVDASPADQVARLATLARRAGLDGIVCSPMEARQMRELLGDEAVVITPGVRPEGSAKGDQMRVATPKEAFEAGASHIVIGRPVTCAQDPVAAFEDIVSSLS